jgi:two-component sensor histidine kinase
MPLADEALDVDAAAVIDPIAEANHRIANNLAIIAGSIRLELANSPDYASPDAQHIRRSLQQLSLQIDAVGRLHRLLMNSDYEGTVDLDAYLHQIIDAAMCSFGALGDTDQTTIQLASDTLVAVPGKHAVAIGLFASEAIINSLKHSHPAGERGTVFISARVTKPNSLLIEIIDDGTTLAANPGSRGMSAGGTGKRLMQSIADSLNANLEFINRDPGHVARLRLPLPGTATHFS